MKKIKLWKAKIFGWGAPTECYFSSKEAAKIYALGEAEYAGAFSPAKAAKLPGIIEVSYLVKPEFADTWGCGSSVEGRTVTLREIERLRVDWGLGDDGFDRLMAQVEEA